jgi:hypothetical protein
VDALSEAARLSLNGRWERGTIGEFKVDADGTVENGMEVNRYLQGMLHTELRNPPTFLVNAKEAGTLRVKVRAVATAGAKLVYRVDGADVKSVDLPDKDGKNDGDAPEYDQVFTFAIPAGAHRLTLDNVGGDWMTMDWIEFVGKFQ